MHFVAKHRRARQGSIIGSFPRLNAAAAMFERVLAGIVLAVCALLLLRLTMSVPRRYRFDAAWRRIWLALRRAGLRAWHWRAARRDARRAREVADEAIRRARDRGDWDGNVYTPKSFRKPPRDKMH
ncbi:MAG TPA: hypothetical protein VNU48_12580 [Burkholderiaceae bacterium]|nr:hypothetical protein [Burkholderiaceae bacterium]